MNIPQNYRKPVLIAVLLHVLLLCLLIFNFASNLFSMPPASSPLKTIHAVSVSQASVNAELKQTEKPVVNQAQVRAEEQAKIEKQEQIAHQEQVEKQEQIAKIQEIQKQKAAAAAAKKALVLQEDKMALLKVQELQKEQKEKEKKAQEAKAAQMKAAEAKAAKMEKLKEQKAEKLQQEKIAEQKLKLAQAEKLKAEQQKLNAEQKALQQKLMQQQMSGEQKSLTQVQSLAQQGAIDKYKAEILAAIQSNWRIDQVNSKLKCVYSVSLAPDGTVLSISLVQSSGDAALDQSAQQAITLSSPLPVPTNPSLFNHFRQLVITLSPQGILGSVSSS